jgi:hypothetical protein
MRSATSRFPENPNEGSHSHSHPHDEYLSFQSARAHHPHAALHQHHPHQNSAQYQLTSTTLASKPHPFSGALMTPDHARRLSPGAVLSLASALSLQAANSAQVSGTWRLSCFYRPVVEVVRTVGMIYAAAFVDCLIIRYFVFLFSRLYSLWQVTLRCPNFYRKFWTLHV